MKKFNCAIFSKSQDWWKNSVQSYFRGFLTNFECILALGLKKTFLRGGHLEFSNMLMRFEFVIGCDLIVTIIDKNDNYFFFKSSKSSKSTKMKNIFFCGGHFEYLITAFLDVHSYFLALFRFSALRTTR